MSVYPPDQVIVLSDEDDGDKSSGSASEAHADVANRELRNMPHWRDEEHVQSDVLRSGFAIPRGDISQRLNANVARSGPPSRTSASSPQTPSNRLPSLSSQPHILRRSHEWSGSSSRPLEVRASGSGPISPASLASALKRSFGGGSGPQAPEDGYSVRHAENAQEPNEFSLIQNGISPPRSKESPNRNSTSWSGQREAFASSGPGEEDSVVVISDDDGSTGENEDRSMLDLVDSFHSPAGEVEQVDIVQSSPQDGSEEPTPLDDMLENHVVPPQETDKSFVVLNDASDSSDDEIAVLSKEEAERLGTFKKASFEQPRFNQPAPVYHAGASSSGSNQASTSDQVIRNYFGKSSVSELEQHQANFRGQLHNLIRSKDDFLAQVASLREQISTLRYDQVTLRTELERTIGEKLQLAEDVIRRSKKVRQYSAIAESVREMKLSLNFFGSGNENENSAMEIDQYPKSNMVNPYVTQHSYEDRANLEKLFKEVYKEEKVEGLSPTPESLSIQLLDHQRRGLFWLLKRERDNSGSILADDMGLGKTVQALALMMANPSDTSRMKTTLIVGPVSLLRQWSAEISSKLRSDFSLSVAFYHGSTKRNFSSFQKLASHDVVLVSYTTLASEFKQHYALAIEEAQVGKYQSALPDANGGGERYSSPFFSADAQFYRIVLDEAQYIKNKISLTSKAVSCLKGRHRLCLTGTPMQNNIDELYPILRFLKARPYDDEKRFKTDISVPLKSTSDNFDNYDKNRSMSKLRAVLSAIMLRRTKDTMVNGKPLLQLPEKKIEKVYVQMEKDEYDFYHRLELGIQEKAKRLLSIQSKTAHHGIFVLLLRLRQACIHQLLVEVGELNSKEQSSFDWEKEFERVLSMGSLAKAVVKQTLGLEEFENDGAGSLQNKAISSVGEVQFTCPVCYDVVGQDSIVILAGCGHMICDGCVDTFFGQGDQHETGANCVICDMSAKPRDLVSYPLFSSVIDQGYNYEMLENIHGASRRGKSSNAQKISMLIRKNNGFMPSAKIQKTLEIIKDITEDTPDEKIIVFSHFTVTFDLMGHALDQEGINYLRYDGSMNIDDKNRTINNFYQGSSRVLLISLKAGNVGLTLTCASHVIMMDPFWNPYVEDQAMDRAHRFGQEREVNVYRILIKNSVEDRITDLQRRKKELIGSALDETALKSSSKLGRRELGYLFGLNTLN